jgi:hypothetical protein
MTEEIQHYVKCPLCSSKDYFTKYHFSKNRYIKEEINKK